MHILDVLILVLVVVFLCLAPTTLVIMFGVFFGIYILVGLCAIALASL